MTAALLLALAAPPGDVVQTHDLSTMTWQRAKALEGRRVRVRFTVGDVVLDGPVGGPYVVLVRAVGPEYECRFVTLPRQDRTALNGGARLEAEGVLRVEWRRYLPWAGAPVVFIVTLDNARLVK
jgi:hypothetical protein